MSSQKFFCFVLIKHGLLFFQPIFQRYPRLEKEYQSFSLIYNDRSLDLVRFILLISRSSYNSFYSTVKLESFYYCFLKFSDLFLLQICKDKDEADVWFSGLKALISRSHHRKWRTESRSDGIPSEVNSPRTYTRRSSPLNSPFGSNDSLQKVWFLVPLCTFLHLC